MSTRYLLAILAALLLTSCQTVSAAQQAAQLAQQTAEAAKAGGINASEFATGLAGAVGTGAVALNSWRNLTRKKDLNSAKVA